MESAVGSKQASVRQSALGLYEECYKWIGESINPAVQKLNKPQQDELEKLFTKIKESGAGKPMPTRITKQEEEQLKQAEVDEICAKEEEEEKQGADVFDLEEEQDALAKYGLDWAEDVLKQK
jgi:phosphopantothenoylcysteine synthetase/decarboxylase